MLEKDIEKKNGGGNKNTFEKNGEKNNGCGKKIALEKARVKKNEGCGKKDALEKNGEKKNGREERRTRDIGMTSRRLLVKWLFTPVARDRKGGRGTGEAFPRSRKGGRGTNRPDRCAGGSIRSWAAGGENPTGCPRTNSVRGSGSEPKRRGASKPEN